MEEAETCKKPQNDRNITQSKKVENFKGAMAGEPTPFSEITFLSKGKIRQKAFKPGKLESLKNLRGGKTFYI